MPNNAPAITDALEHNTGFAQSFTHGQLAAPPARKLLVITCMDARIDVEQALGLGCGDAHILRNAGGSVTDDALRSAIVSTNVLGTRQIMVINHTKCGMLGCTDQALHDQFTQQHGPIDNAPEHFHGFDDLNDHVREQVAKLTSHQWIPADTVVRGFTYDVTTGRLHEVDCS